MEWKIQKGGRECERCRRAFGEGEEHFSQLFLETQACRRENVCAACWSSPASEAFSFWKTRRPEAGAPPPDNRPAQLAAFQKLAAEAGEDPNRRKLLFLLALLLVRKRVLKLSGSDRAGGQEFITVQVAATGESHRVLNPDIKPEELVALQEEINALFEGGV